MKKLLLSAVVLASVSFTSCGGVTVCDCAKTLPEAMMKDYEAAAGDEAKIKEVEKKYESQFEECKKLEEGKSPEELKAMMDEVANCK